jgi:hypothetical protein
MAQILAGSFDRMIPSGSYELQLGLERSLQWLEHGRNKALSMNVGPTPDSAGARRPGNGNRSRRKSARSLPGGPDAGQP